MDYSAIFTTVQTEVMEGITAVAPMAAIVFGTIFAISIAIKVFGKIAKKANCNYFS